MLQIGGRAQSLRHYAEPIAQLQAEAAKTYPRPAKMVALCRNVVAWAGRTAHTWESIEKSGALSTIALAARQMGCWSSEVVENPDELRDLLWDLCGGGPEQLTGTFRNLVSVAGDPDIRRKALDEYEDVLDILDPERESSDSSNPRDHGARYAGSSEESSAESIDSSDDHDSHARLSVLGYRGDDGRVAPDHERYVAAGEYATLIEFLRGRSAGSRLLDEFRSQLSRRHDEGEHPFPPLLETAIVRRFHPRASLGVARQQAGNLGA